jgi:hypothetical protein
MLGELLHDQAIRQVLRQGAKQNTGLDIVENEASHRNEYRLAWTFKECLASTAESKTLDECAPSLRDSLIEYSLSDLPRPWFRSYSSNLEGRGR